MGSATSGVSSDTLQVPSDFGAGACRPAAERRLLERPPMLRGRRRGHTASFLVWPRPRPRRPRGAASPGRGSGPHHRPRPTALTWEPSPGPSITPSARPAAAPAQSGCRRSPGSTPQPPLAHFRLEPRPRCCARSSAANPPRGANPRPLSHGGGTFSPLENQGRAPPSFFSGPALGRV